MFQLLFFIRLITWAFFRILLEMMELLSIDYIEEFFLKRKEVFVNTFEIIFFVNVFLLDSVLQINEQ